MARGKFISYLRVSTQKQGHSGLGLEAQRKAVNDYLNGGRWALVKEFLEVESGKRNDRPALAKALALCRVHNATLLVAKLDRLARNVAFISSLMESGVDFVAVDLPEANKLTVHIMAAMAEYEAQAISSRTKAALAAAKARGVRLGGNRENVKSVIHKYADKGVRASAEARRDAAAKRAADLQPVIEAIREDGATSLREIAAVLNEREIPAPRDGKWTAMQVSRILASD